MQLLFMSQQVLQFVLIFLICPTVYGQVVDGYVKDEFNKPVKDAYIISRGGDTLSFTNELGYFDTEYQQKLSFGVYAKGYPIYWVTPKKGDLDPIQVQLGLRYQELEAVMITRKGMEVALDIESVNIIDYRPFNGYFLTLKKQKKQYMLGVDSLGAEGINFTLDIKQPKGLYIDCMKNTYVLNEDSAYQVHVQDRSLLYISTLPLKTFNKYIASCVSDFDNGLVLQEFTGYNQKYELTLYDGDQAKPFFSKLDTVGYNIAYENLHRMHLFELLQKGDTLAIKEYQYRQAQLRSISSRTTPEYDPMQYYEPYFAYEQYPVGDIRNRSIQQWRQRNYYNERHRRMSSRRGPVESRASLEAAKMLSSQALQIETFQLGSFMMVVDYDLDSVKIYNNQGEFQQAVHYVVDNEVEAVWKDRSTGYLYLYCSERGSHKMYSLNPFTGETTYVKSFEKAPKTRSVQVFDGWVYFRVLDRGYYGINRVKLPPKEMHRT